MNTIAIITARGGSKRIPKKNIKEFMGKPMIAYAIDAAQKSEIFDEVMVSTDDLEIAEIAKKYGARIPFMRSERTASDYATTADVLLEVIEKYQMASSTFQSFCCIYPCVPFLSAQTLQNAFTKLNDNQAVIPVCKYPVPIEWAMKLKDDLLLPNDPRAQNMRSQDILPKYYDAGMFYFCKTDVFLQYKTLVPPKTAGYIIPEEECQDIDTIEDWQQAELKFKILHAVRRNDD